MATEDVTALRDRLLRLRASTFRQLSAADHLDAGLLAVLGNVGAALVALDQMAVGVSEGGRVVATDDGSEIRIALYDPAGTIATAPISAQWALALAGQLVSAAARRL